MTMTDDRARGWLRDLETRVAILEHKIEILEKAALLDNAIVIDDSPDEKLIIGREVISNPDDGIKITQITLSKRAKAGLSADGVHIPSDDKVVVNHCGCTNGCSAWNCDNL